MFKTSRIGWQLLLLSLVAIGTTAHADTIGPNCGTCQGGIYTLTVGPGTDNGDGTSTYTVDFTINSAGYNGGGTLIDNVAFKVTSSTVTLLSESAPANWTPQTGGLSNGGCNGNGAGWVCAFANSLGSAISVGGTQTWVFSITIPNGTLFASGDDSIKVRYTNVDGTKVGAIVSETFGTATPEPATLLLFGSGLSGLALLLRKRAA